MSRAARRPRDRVAATAIRQSAAGTVSRKRSPVPERSACARHDATHNPRIVVP